MFRYPKWVRWLFVAALVTACSSPSPPPSPPATADAEQLAPAAPTQTDPAQADPALTGPAQVGPAVGNGPGMPTADDADVAMTATEPVAGWQVTVTASAVLRTGRGPYFLRVADVAPGDVLGYVGSAGGWLRVRTAAGAVGWISGEAAHLAAADGRQVQYEVRPGRWAIRPARPLPSVVVTRDRSGPLRVSLVGAAGAAVHRPYPGVVRVQLPAPVAGALAAYLDVGDSGLRTIRLDAAGVSLEFNTSAPAHRVIAAGDDLDLEFRPALQAVHALDGGGYAIRWQGEVFPQVDLKAFELTVTLPGTLAEAVVPPPITVRMVVAGVELALPRPDGGYSLRPHPDGIDVLPVSPGLKGKRVVIDPGHGGDETGAVGSGGNVEADVNLALGLAVADALQAAGATVILTRRDAGNAVPAAALAALATAPERIRFDLEARTDLANRQEADLLVSIHHNGGDTGQSGTEVWWAQRNANAERSQRLAHLLQNALVAELGLADRGVKSRNFHVLRETWAPAALVEVGFLSDPQEEAYVATPAARQRATRAIVGAVAAYFQSAE